MVVVLVEMVGVVEVFISDVEVLEETVVEEVVVEEAVVEEAVIEEAAVEGAIPIVVRIEAFSPKRRTPTPVSQSQKLRLFEQQYVAGVLFKHSLTPAPPPGLSTLFVNSFYDLDASFEVVNHLPFMQNAGQASEVHDLSVQVPLTYLVGLVAPFALPTALHRLFDKQA